MGGGGCSEASTLLPTTSSYAYGDRMKPPVPLSFRFSRKLISALDKRAKEMSRRIGIPITRAIVVRSILEEALLPREEVEKDEESEPVESSAA